MAKKKNVKKKDRQIKTGIDEKVLPQNILSVGEHVTENKNIYISQPVYKEIHRFTRNKTKNESGGMLIGYTMEEFGKTNIVILGFVEAKFCEATPTTLKFTHETWEYVHKEAEKKYPNGKIVGWIHTHPNYGIFLSEYDTFIHENFFSEEHQVAYVVDPVQQIEGFYFWIGGKLERCKGFYIFDKTGVKIDAVGFEENETARREQRMSGGLFQSIVTGVLAAAAAFLLFAHFAQNNELAKLQKQQENLMNSTNAALVEMQLRINTLSEKIEGLEASLKEAGVLPEEQETGTNADGETDDGGTAEGADHAE